MSCLVTHSIYIHKNVIDDQVVEFTDFIERIDFKEPTGI